LCRVRPSHIQGIALAADLKAVFHARGRKKEHAFPLEKRDILLGSVRISPNHSSVFWAPSPGHQVVPVGPGLSLPEYVLGVGGERLGK
jgi:hypothetical protein